MSSEALEFIQALAFAKSRAALDYLRMSVMFSWQRRWTRMLSVSAASTFAHGLLALAKTNLQLTDGEGLDLYDLFVGRDDLQEDCLPNAAGLVESVELEGAV